MIDDVKAVAVEQLAIFSRVETRMIERLALESPAGFPKGRAAGEHQRCASAGMSPKDRKHSTLVRGAQMEEAVPGEQTVERRIQVQGAHVRNKPGRAGKIALGDFDHFWRRIDPRDGTPRFKQIARDWLSRTATDIEHLRFGGQMRDEAVE